MLLRKMKIYLKIVLGFHVFSLMKSFTFFYYKIYFMLKLIFILIVLVGKKPGICFIMHIELIW